MIKNGLDVRLELNKMSLEDQTALVKRQQENIKSLTEECEKVWHLRYVILEIWLILFTSRDILNKYYFDYKH